MEREKRIVMFLQPPREFSFCIRQGDYKWLAGFLWFFIVLSLDNVVIKFDVADISQGFVYVAHLAYACFHL